MRVLTLRATDGESTPPAMTEEEKAAGMVWRFVGATTPVNQKPNEAQVGIYHTWELSQGPSQKPTAMVEEPSFMDTVGLGRMERHRERHRAQQEQIRAWFLNPEAPVADRIHVMKGFLPHELLMLARRIEIDGVVVKDRGGSPIPAMATPAVPGKHVWHDCKVHGHIQPAGEHSKCISCEGGLGGCVVCGQWEAQIEDVCPGVKQPAPVQGAFPTPIPGDTCATCDGNSSGCPLCNPTEAAQ